MIYREWFSPGAACLVLGVLAVGIPAHGFQIPHVKSLFTDTSASSIGQGLLEADSWNQGRELYAARDQTSFALSIEAAIQNHLRPSVVSLGGNEKVFQIPDPTASGEGLQPVGLFTHAMCPLSNESTQETIDQILDPETLSLANEFAAQFNRARERYQRALFSASAFEARDEILRLYGRLSGCLAYTESLSTADSSASKRIAEDVAPVDYVRPSGVLFYLDAAQSDPDSRLNIGLYQFSPVRSGNIQACIQNWNSLYPFDAINRSSRVDEMIRKLGESSQLFNAFCGIDKILQSFFVQVNTTAVKRTHPENRFLDRDGHAAGIKPPRERCVSLHFNRQAYNHFGPFQNSTRQNLKHLMRCTLGSKFQRLSY